MGTSCTACVPSRARNLWHCQPHHQSAPEIPRRRSTGALHRMCAPAQKLAIGCHSERSEESLGQSATSPIWPRDSSSLLRNSLPQPRPRGGASARTRSVSMTTHQAAPAQKLAPPAASARWGVSMTTHQAVPAQKLAPPTASARWGVRGDADVERFCGHASGRAGWTSRNDTHGAQAEQLLGWDDTLFSQQGLSLWAYKIVQKTLKLGRIRRQIGDADYPAIGIAVVTIGRVQIVNR
jgi:hypothetical protein